MRWACSISLLLWAILRPFDLSTVDGQTSNNELKSILSAWQLRQKSNRSLQYSLKAQRLVPQGTYTGSPELPPDLRKQKVPEKDYISSMSVKWMIDFENNRIRKDINDHEFHFDLGTFVPSRGVYIYDGSSTKRYFPKESNRSLIPIDRLPEVGILANGNSVDYRPIDYPIFLAQGVVGLTTLFTAPQGPTRIIVPVEPRNLSLVDARPLADIRCVVVKYQNPDETNWFEELWVDLEKRSAVVRMDIYYGRNLESRLDIEYRHQGDYPKSWTLTRFDPTTGRITLSESAQVEKLDTDLPISANYFDVEIKPGMIVRKGDTTLAKKGFDLRNYRLEADGKTFTELTDGEQPTRQRRTFLPILGGCAVLVVVLMILRHKRMLRFGSR